MEFNDKQVQILEAAEQLFADKGFEGTSVRDVAEVANVNVAMISYYFGSKEKMLDSLFSYRSEASLMKLESMLYHKNITTLQKVNMLIDYYIDKIQDQPCFYKIMMREQVASFRPTTTAMIMDFKRKNQALIEQLIHEGQKKGEFKKHIEVPLMMATLIGTVSHIITTQYYYRELNNLQSLSDTELNTLLKKKLSNYLKQLFKAILTYEE
jgi:AcrR family transcriptional regulator